MPMKIVSVWNPKGGQGKSLIALNLAAAAVSELELKPLVLCRDPQGTAMLSQAEGNLPFDVKPSYPKGAAKYDLVIADHVASDWEVPPAPTVIIPTKPVRTDYATFCDALTRLEKAGKWIIQVVTDGSMARRGERAMILAMRRAGAFAVFGSRFSTWAAPIWIEAPAIAGMPPVAAPLTPFTNSLPMPLGLRLPAY